MSAIPTRRNLTGNEGPAGPRGPCLVADGMMSASFVRWKFNRMLAVGTLTMVLNYIVILSGCVIVGNIVGAGGLAGVNACTPVFGSASFLASLISVGAALVFSRAMGAFDEHRSSCVFSHAMVAAIGLGASIFAVMWFGESTFLDLTGVTDGSGAAAGRALLAMADDRDGAPAACSDAGGARVRGRRRGGGVVGGRSACDGVDRACGVLHLARR